MSSVSLPAGPAVAVGSREGARILGAVAASVAVIAAAVLATYGIGEEGLGLLTRYLARLAFPFFVAAFTASALAELFPSGPTAWLVRRRRWIGLSFALVMLAHLIAIAAFFAVRSEEPPFGTSQVVGGIGFLVIAAMAATSNDAAVRALGRERWARLHRAGLYFLWFIFAVTYLGGVSRNPVRAAGFAVVLAALGLRIAAWRHRRGRRAR